MQIDVSSGKSAVARLLIFSIIVLKNYENVLYVARNTDSSDWLSSIKLLALMGAIDL